MTELYKCLEERGFIDQKTSEKLSEIINKPLTLYLGIDPTAPSIHVGNLVGVMMLFWFQKYGHNPYALIGGATGLIGDPSGKSLERPFLDKKILKENVVSIEKFLKNLFKRNISESALKVVNNEEWFSKISFIDFLRDIGKQFR